ncbi:MAG TPA: LuxR family transcriptional regulator, partial [Acidimicrobiia bacterium]|nr:LuxR family transcriptional regulator [Acidimicrobiia bacterium]
MVAAPSPAPVADRWREHVLELCQERSADDEFLGELARRLRRLVPFDAWLFVATDPATTLPTPPVRLDNLDEDCHSFWERELLVEDVLLYRDLARRPVPAGTVHSATAGYPARSTRHRELSSRNGFGDELRVAFRSGDRCWGVGSLWRSRGSPHFSDGEVQQMAQLSDPIAGAFRRGVLAAEPAPTGDPTGPGLLVFDRAGTFNLLNEDAAPWLNELRGGPDRINEHGVLIPTEVYSVVSQARAVAAGLSAAPARTRVRTRSGGWLALHASCLRHADGALGDTAVVVEPAYASEVAHIIAQAYGLTPREHDVTQMIAQGLDTAEIAEA